MRARSVVHREIVLLVLLTGGATLAFFLTRAAAADSRRTRLQDAAAWAEVGETAAQGGRLTEAVDALRHASALDRENRDYRLALARTLADDHQEAAAQQVLLGLRDVAPEDPTINLQLARLAARLDDLPSAIRYYQNALYGLWAPDQQERRREIRTELVKLLLEHDEDSRALSELLVLSANLPDEPGPQVEVGRLFLEAGEPSRALDHFTSALQHDDRDGAALAGAGEAAFALGEYTPALDYLRRAPADLGRVAELTAVTSLVLSNDPLTPRLASAERRRRLQADFERAAGRLDACLAGPRPDAAPLQALKAESDAFAAAIEEGALRREPDAIDTGFDLAYRIQRATETGCGAPEPLDQAILLIGRRHGLETS